MKILKSVLLTILGSAIAAAAVALFLNPNKIVGGGVSGIATILYHVAHIPLGVTAILSNIILLLCGLKVLGKSFILKTLLGAGAFSLFAELFSYLPSVTDDVIVATLFGGALFGLGIGIALASGSSTGGTDILGRLIQYKLPHISIGKLLMVVDGLIILASLIVFKQISLVCYGVLTLVVQSFAIDQLIKMLNTSKVVYVITDKGDEIADCIVTTSPRGVTKIQAVGGYTNNQKQMLFCALKDNELEAFQQKIKNIDPDSFVVYTEARQIVGNGFRVYR